MSDVAVKNIIEKRLGDNWVLSQISWENMKYSPKRGESFVEANVIETDSFKSSFDCMTRIYTVTIKIFVPRNSGVELISSYADQLKTLFEGYKEGFFHCIKGRSENPGAKGNWYRRHVILKCKYKG